MKNMRIAAVVWAALFCASGFVQVAPVSANAKESVEEHVRDLKDKLKLTSEQESQVRTAIQEKKNKIQDAVQEAHDKIRSVLNEDQREKFNEIVAKKEKKH